MKKSMVVSAVFDHTWAGQDGPLYDHTIEFENGDKGAYTSKSEEQTKFVEGEEAEYTIEQKGKYFKVKPVQQQRGGGYSGGGGGGKAAFVPRNEKPMAAQHALGRSTELVIAGKVDMKDILACADKFFAWTCKNGGLS